MGKKKIKAIVGLQIAAGKATPAPPVGTALGPHGVNIMEFCKAYNEQTQSQSGSVVPVKITIFEDRTFVFELKTPPAADLLKKAAGVDKGAGKAQEPVGSVTEADILAIAQLKMVDLNAFDLDHAANIIKGTARSMGIKVTAN